MNDTILLERAEAVATLTLNRPQSLNALDLAMIDALVECAQTVAEDPAVRCVVIRGAGKHFMAGGDIPTFQGFLDRSSAARTEALQQVITRVHAAVETLQRMPKPVVASVHGAVAGFGLSLMLGCDLAVADDTAYFTSAYRHLGVTPDGGCTWFLPRLVGTRNAMEIVLLGERFDAATALSLGLLNRVVPSGELETATATLVGRLLGGPSLAIANGKRLVAGSLSHTLSEHLRAEADSFAACAGTEDFIEGVNAFIGKRPPVFGGGKS